MHIDRLWLTNFRNYESVDLSFPSDGVVVVCGQNGQGKTNLLEAIGHVANLHSFRGASTEAMVRVGAESAVVRAEGQRDGRQLLIETELQVSGRNRTLINRQPMRRVRELLETLLAVVFAPDDLQLVKAGPAFRRDYLDEIIEATDLKAGQARRDLERILKQRNTLLRQAGGRVDATITTTLDVWDNKLAEVGEICGDHRGALVENLQPYVQHAYQQLAGESARVGMSMTTQWRSQDGGKGLLEALLATRSSDLARGVTAVGPHRDELDMSISGMPTRTHTSQGEQRTLALALRLAAHRYLQQSTGSPAILLLDDVFSELDHDRARALIREMPAGQAFVSTATGLPEGMEVTATVVIEEGTVRL